MRCLKDETRTPRWRSWGSRYPNVLLGVKFKEQVRKLPGMKCTRSNVSTRNGASMEQWLYHVLYCWIRLAVQLRLNQVSSSCLEWNQREIRSPIIRSLKRLIMLYSLFFQCISLLSEREREIERESERERGRNVFSRLDLYTMKYQQQDQWNRNTGMQSKVQHLSSMSTFPALNGAAAELTQSMKLAVTFSKLHLCFPAWNTESANQPKRNNIQRFVQLINWLNQSNNDLSESINKTYFLHYCITWPVYQCKNARNMMRWSSARKKGIKKYQSAARWWYSKTLYRWGYSFLSSHKNWRKCN